MAFPVKTDYHREMGARILLGLAARELARRDKAVVPLLTHATDHYVRNYLRIEHGAKVADRCLEKMGYIEHCIKCGCFKAASAPRPENCAVCGSPTILAGPLWLGQIQDPQVISRAAFQISLQNKNAKKLLEVCGSEADLPLYYDHHRICRRLGITPKKADQVVDALREAGWRASRTHFTGVGIKTDAEVRDVEEILMLL
jgi:tRNA (guanine26-N2/guanine27-N2)-dimethyltransferase